MRKQLTAFVAFAIALTIGKLSGLGLFPTVSWWLVIAAILIDIMTCYMDNSGTTNKLIAQVSIFLTKRKIRRINRRISKNGQ